MSTRPLFDMSQAQPINEAAQGKPLFDMSKALPLSGAGEQINDVGNRVIVPKEGESFSDTMARASAYGKTVTPAQINAEVKTMPGKIGTVLAAAPAIGLAGAAALAGTGEAAQAGFQVLKSILPQKATMDQVVKVAKMVKDLGLTAASARYLYHQFYPND